MHEMVIPQAFNFEPVLSGNEKGHHTQGTGPGDDD